MTHKPLPRGDEGRADEPVDGRAGLDRMADLTRRIVSVPKDAVPPHKPKRRAKRGR